MTFFFSFVCFMRAISGAFHPPWLSISWVQQYSLTLAVKLPSAIKQHGQVVGASSLIFSEIDKTALAILKTISGRQMSAAVKTDTARHWRWCDGGIPEKERMSCHLHLTVWKEKSFKGDAIQLFLRKWCLLFVICSLCWKVIADSFHTALHIKCNLIYESIQWDCRFASFGF